VLGPIAIPERIERILDGALVCELTVISRVGHPISHPMIPLYDGEKLYLPLEIPFSKKVTTSKSCGWRSTNEAPEHGAHLPALANHELTHDFRLEDVWALPGSAARTTSLGWCSRWPRSTRRKVPPAPSAHSS